MEPKIYTKGDGTKIDVTLINNFELVNGFAKSAVAEVTKMDSSSANFKICKDELLRRLAPMSAEKKNELMEALNHMDELADIGAEEGEEKSDLEKSYTFLTDFITKL